MAAGVGDGRALRGAERRRSLVAAGVEVLADCGWAGVTGRAVAERSGAPLGLIHYHFGNVDGLQTAIAREGARQVIGEAVQRIVSAGTVSDGVSRFAATLRHVDGRAGRVALATLGRASTDAEVASAVADALRGARAEIAAWLTERHGVAATAAPALAASFVALVDGVSIHALMDPSFPVDAVAANLGALVEGMVAASLRA